MPDDRRWVLMPMASMHMFTDPAFAETAHTVITESVLRITERDHVDLVPGPPEWIPDILYPWAGQLRFEGRERRA